MSEAKKFGTPSYGIVRRLAANTDWDAARAKVEAALAEQGFGVLTEIDVKATLKKKIDVDVAPYLILGACNPKLAHQALQGEPGIGLLLPCNVVMTRDAEGLVVAAIDPGAMFSVVEGGGAQLEALAEEVRRRLTAALDAATA